MRKSMSQTVRRAVYEKYDGHCAYCGCKIPFKGFNVDHLHCLRHYEYLDEITGIDVNSIDNLMPACGSCNRYKSTMDLETFRKQLQKIPDRLKRDVCTYGIALRFGMIQEQKEAIKFYFERLEMEGNKCEENT
jgi:5-methylcytosine-specific restriction endonuclease McrA